MQFLEKICGYFFCLFLYISLQNKIWLDPTREKDGVNGNAMYYHQIKIGDKYDQIQPDFFCSLTVCHLVSQKCTIFFTFFCFVLLRVYFGFENCLLLNPCVASLDYKN